MRILKPFRTVIRDRRFKDSRETGLLRLSLLVTLPERRASLPVLFVRPASLQRCAQDNPHPQTRRFGRLCPIRCALQQYNALATIRSPGGGSKPERLRRRLSATFVWAISRAERGKFLS